MQSRRCARAHACSRTPESPPCLKRPDLFQRTRPMAAVRSLARSAPVAGRCRCAWRRRKTPCESHLPQEFHPVRAPVEKRGFDTVRFEKTGKPQICPKIKPRFRNPAEKKNKFVRSLEETLSDATPRIFISAFKFKRLQRGVLPWHRSCSPGRTNGDPAAGAGPAGGKPEIIRQGRS